MLIKSNKQLVVVSLGGFLPIKTLTDKEIQEMRERYYMIMLKILQQADDWLKQNADLIYLLGIYTGKLLKEYLFAMTAAALLPTDEIINKFFIEGRKIREFDCNLKHFWVEGALNVWVECNLVVDLKEDDREREEEYIDVHGEDEFEVSIYQRPDYKENLYITTVSSSPRISLKARVPEMPFYPVNAEDISNYLKLPGIEDRIDEVLEQAERDCKNIADKDKLRLETIFAYADVYAKAKEYTDKIDIVCNVKKNCQDVECEVLVPNDDDDVLTLSYRATIIDLDTGKIYTLLHYETPVYGRIENTPFVAQTIRLIRAAVTRGGIFLNEERK